MKIKMFIVGALISGFLFTGSIWPNGKAIFTSKGCVACHQPKVDATGPSLHKIATAYRGKMGQLIRFLKGKGRPKLNKGKFAGQFQTTMKPQLAQIKTLSPGQIKALAKYILSH